MPTAHHIRNPFEMAIEQLSAATLEAGHAVHTAALPQANPAAPVVRRIELSDLWDALRRGVDDFAATRDDVLFIALIYPLAGLVLARLAFSHDLVPLIFPLASGFAIIGPAAAIGLYELSRRREQGASVSWIDGFSVLRSPAMASIFGLGLILLAVFLAWLAAAWGVYALTLGPTPPVSIGAFAHDVLMTAPGWTMIAAGVFVGFLFAVLALAISVVSFPLLLDRHVGVGRAIATSVRAVVANPAPMAVWGAVVAGALVVGSAPALVGLIFVVPVLGHGTWHLYRKLVTDA